MKNAFKNTVHMINHAQSCLQTSNYVEAKNFLDMAMEKDEDHSYAAFYKEAIRMIKSGQNRYHNFGDIKDKLYKCKSMIEKHHITSLNKQIIIAMNVLDSKSKKENQELEKLHARMTVMLTIIQNIESNIDLMDKGDTNQYYIEVDSEKSISDMMQSKNQIFIDEANSEAEHGIGKLSYIRLLKEEPKKKKGKWGGIGSFFAGVAKGIVGLAGTVLSLGQWKSAVDLMKDGAKDIQSAFSGKTAMSHRVVQRNLQKSYDSIIAQITSSVKDFGKDINMKSDVAKVLKWDEGLEEVKEKLKQMKNKNL